MKGVIVEVEDKALRDNLLEVISTLNPKSSSQEQHQQSLVHGISLAIENLGSRIMHYEKENREVRQMNENRKMTEEKLKDTELQKKNLTYEVEDNKTQLRLLRE